MNVWLPMDNLRVWGIQHIDQEAVRQAQRSARLPIVPLPIALMPDAHVGIGATVGSVIPTEGAIIPAAVGVDIGCGMIATHTTLTASDLPDNLDPLVSLFSRSIPAGVGRGHDTKGTGHSNHARAKRATGWLRNHPHTLPDNLANTAFGQLGSLGSGNHFLEVCLDESDSVWLVLHSGSRGVGNKLADRHIKLAKAQHQSLEDPDLAYFLEGTAEFESYISDMLWSQDYARENREIMMSAALEDFFRFADAGAVKDSVNCHHNFTQREEHQGRMLWITRKGAIEATDGQWGVIPGSMGTKSYITKGLGNPDSYNSSSHGAGRQMSRSQAKKNLTQESLNEAMKGKAWNQQPAALLDEHPAAYKDIDTVMEAQKDTTRIVHALRQVVNYKGCS